MYLRKCFILKTVFNCDQKKQNKCQSITVYFNKKYTKSKKKSCDEHVID